MRRILLLFVMAFVLGWAVNESIDPLLVYDREKPLAFSFLTGTAVERASPGDHVLEKDIHVYHDRVVLDVPEAFYARYAGTNSMDPFLDENANGIEVRPAHPGMIGVGDVISYRSPFADGILVHRVIRTGADGNGSYFIVQGDNNEHPDPVKVRFEDVHGLLVGIVY